MPKPIKRKAARSQQKPEEELQSFLLRVQEFTGGRERHLLAYAVAIVAIIAMSLGLYYYQMSRGKRAAELRYEGYKKYYSLYEGIPGEGSQRAEEALLLFQEANEKKESPSALMYIANSRYERGDYPGTVSALEELVRKFPEDRGFVPLAYYKMGLARLRAGDRDAALEAFDTLSRFGAGPFGDLALVEAARVREDMGRLDEALADYGTVVRDFPASPFFEEASEKTGLQGTEGGSGMFPEPPVPEPVNVP